VIRASMTRLKVNMHPGRGPVTGEVAQDPADGG